MSRSSRLRSLCAALLTTAVATAGYVATAPTAQASEPQSRDFLVSESSAGRISQFTDASGTLTPRFADLPSVRDSAVAPDGTVWVTDNQQVIHLSASGDRLRSFGGFSRPWGVLVDEAGTVYVSDENHGTVSRLRPGTDAFEVLARPGGGPVTMSFALNGDLLLPLYSGNKVVRISRAGTVTDAVTGLSNPVDAVQASDGAIIVSEQNTGAIKRFPVSGPGTTIASIEFGAFGMALSDDSVLVTNYIEGTITRASLSGGPATVVGSGLTYPLGLAPASATQTPQRVSITSTPPVAAVVGDSYALSATGGGSGKPVTFSISTPSVCSLDSGGTTVRLEHAGTCTVAADQAGGTRNGITYTAAERVTQDIAVGRAPQTILFAEGSPVTGTVNGGFSPSATGGGSGSDVTFASDSPDVCSYDADSGAVIYLTEGDCEITADQDGSDDYEAAAQARHVVAVDKNAQEVEFTSQAPEAAVVGGSYTPAATGGASGLPVVFGTSTDACSHDDETGKVLFDHAGTCTVTAGQEGDTAYAPANQATQEFEIGKAAQTITFAPGTPSTGRVGNTFTPSADTGTGDLAVSFSSLTPDTCSVGDGVVSYTGVGTCTVAADQTGDEDHEAAQQVTRSIELSLKDLQSITFTGAPSTGVVGRSFVLSASGGASGNAVSLELAEGSTGCTLTYPDDLRTARGGNPTVAFTSPGTCRILASQSGDEQYAGTSAELVTTVRRAPDPEPPAPEAAPTTTTVTTTADGLVATVSTATAGTAPTGTPTGTVAFTVDGETVGTADLSPVDGMVGTAVAALDEAVGSGAHVVGATYEGTVDWATSSGTYERRDPALTARVVSSRKPNEAGWYRTPVTVRFTCAAGSAALVGDCPDPVKRRNTVPGFHVERTVTTTDGGAATVRLPVKVDVRGPVLDIDRRGAAPWSVGARPVRCEASDGRSGVAGDCTVTYGDLVVGRDGVTRRPWVARASDVAGNTTTRRGSFQVA